MAAEVQEMCKGKVGRRENMAKGIRRQTPDHQRLYFHDAVSILRATLRNLEEGREKGPHDI